MATTYRLFVFVALISSSLSANAQNSSSIIEPSRAEQAAYDSTFRAKQAENDEFFKFFSFEIHPQIGYTNSSYDGLNALLAQASYPTIPNSYFSSGGGGSMRIKHVMVGVDGVLCDFNETNQNRRTELYSSNTLLRLGYCWFNPKYTHSFTPHIGFAFGAADITLTDLTAAAPTNAGTLLTGAPYANVLHYRDRNLALGFGYELYPNPDLRRRIVLGLYADYMVRLGDGRYYPVDYKQRVEGPAINPFLFNLRAHTGFIF